MKTSLSSTITYHHRILVLIAFAILFLLIITPTQSSISEAHHNMLHVRRRSHPCHPISTQPPPVFCFQLQRIRHSPSPPPPNKGDEIDPRYGVEKRLVPSGPNPLHN
ncbi:hypothetical protein Pfo_009555 [Paulownia fortunei]|nr:hypothetical protein Pfo_009555 [Paulownia fortunei]